MATTGEAGAAALAQKLVSGKLKSAKIHGHVAVSRAVKKTKTAKKNDTKKVAKKSSGESFTPRLEKSDGTKRKVYKAGSGLREDIIKRLKAGQTIEAIAHSFGKENKDISWYISKMKKDGTLPKNFVAKREKK
jgi:hypothetical protein